MGSPTVVHGSQSEPESPLLTTGSMAVWVVLGFCGSVGMVLTGTRIGSVPDPGHYLWWFSIPKGGSVVSAGFYVSIVLLIAGWLGVGRGARQGLLTTGRAWLILAVWGAPLFLGPPLFSRDIYSYIGQGMIAHHGLNPYKVGPSVLGKGPLLASIASVWRTTTSPYGPLFVISCRFVVGVTGGSLIAEVLAFRTLELVGVVLIMVSLPRLARHLGTDPGVALWLGALSPLALFSFIASGHNDALMVGLLLAGVTLAVEGRLVPGLVLCALAATVKLPAAAAIVFLAADQFTATNGIRRWTVVIKAVVVTAIVFVGVTMAAGFGWTWLGTAALHVPTELRVDSTPAVSLGTLFFHLLHMVGIPVRQSATVTVTQAICGIAAVAASVWLLLNIRKLDVVRALGIALLLIVIGSPTVWPWYLMWGLALLAATRAQRSAALAVVAALAMLIVGPSGTPLLSGGAYIIVSLATVAICVWLFRGQRWRSVVTGHVI